MPGCSPLQITPSAGTPQTFFLQVVDSKGLNSGHERSRAAAGGTRPALAAPFGAAGFAGSNAATAWRRRYQEWMEVNVPPRTSADLFGRLPLRDAVTLAALVGTGRMTWPEIKAALDAMIKLAAADTRDKQSDERHARPARRTPAQVAEDEIWARYHAQCDQVFAGDANATDAEEQSLEELWRTERILDSLRSVRDRDLAAARRRLEARPSQPTLSAITLEPLHAGVPWTHLSPPESTALRKLDATGFVGSAGMNAAIDTLVSEIADTAA